MNELGKLLLLLGTGYAGYQGQRNQNKAQEYDWQRQADRDRLVFEEAARRKAREDQERADKAAVGQYFGNNMNAPQPAGSLAPFDSRRNMNLPGVEQIPYTNSVAPMPETQEEAAARALKSLTPDQLGLAKPYLSLLPSRDEKRMDEMVTLPDGTSVPRWQLNERLKLDPPVAPPRPGEIATVKRTIDAAIGLATSLGRTDILAILQGLTLNSPEELLNAGEIAADALNNLLVASGKRQDEERQSASLGLGVQEAARIAGPRDIPIGPMGANRNLATGALTPQEIPPLSRQSVLPALGGIQDPVARAEAERLLNPMLDEQDALNRLKAAADAKRKEPTAVIDYMLNKEGNIIEIPTDQILPADEAYKVSVANFNRERANQGNWNSNYGPKATAGINKTITDTEFKQWQMDEYLPAKMKIDSEYKDATIRLREAGNELRAKGLEQNRIRWEKTFNQRIKDGEWDRLVDARNIARNDAGVLKAYIEVMSKEAVTLIANNHKAKDSTGKIVWYSKEGLTEEQFNTKLAQTQAAIAEVMPDYEARVKELINSSGVGPMAPPTGGVTPPLTGAPTGLPTIDPKAERTRVYNEAAAAAKTAKIKDATTGKTRSLTPQEQKQLINTIMRNRGLI